MPLGENELLHSNYLSLKSDRLRLINPTDWSTIDIKLGANQIDAAAENLVAIKRKFEEDPRGKPPAVLCVLCGLTNAAYQRPDGVFVVPITALKD